MLKLLLAAVLVMYVFLPEMVIFAMRGEWPPDGFGCRGCFRCGATNVPTWVNYLGFGLVISGLTFFGISEIRNKK